MQLTPREKHTLEAVLLLRNITLKELAAVLGLHPRTVQYRLERIMDKWEINQNPGERPLDLIITRAIRNDYWHSLVNPLS